MFDFTRTASFEVDPENGFTLKCPDELPVTDGDKIVPALNHQAELAKFRIFSKDWHNPNAVWVADEENPQFTTMELPNADMRWNSHCNGGTFGAELIEGLPPVTEYDYCVYKGLELDMHPYGACYHDRAKKITTGVIEFLHDKKVFNVIVGGLATDYCVLETVLELRKAGFYVVLNLAACRGIAEETTTAAIDQMQKAGAIIAHDEDQLAELFKNDQFRRN